MAQNIKYWIWIGLWWLMTSCLTHYQWNQSFYHNYESGNFKTAKEVLENDRKAEKRNTKLLYWLNMGLVSSMLGEYELSNSYFEKAYLLSENYQKNYLQEIFSYFTNPMVVEYKGEDYEILLIHYYKALNYLKLGEKEKALVECKRMNLLLLTMSDRYADEQKYRRDAFIHNLMGIIYEANHDYNNAFIAYRNAVEIYEEDYKTLFGLDIPQQLKIDLMRTAYLMGFEEELERIEKKFGFAYTKERKEGGELIFFWHNGLAPVKSEWSINFAVNRVSGRQVIFTNDELGLRFPFPIEVRENRNGDFLNNLSTFRVAFPKYIPRFSYFTAAELKYQNKTYPLYLAQNLQAIAIKTLQQKMVGIFSKTLLRIAIKKAEEAALRKNEKEGFARLMNLINSATEQADTRGWMAVPNSIYYTRVYLAEGRQKIQFHTYAPQNTKSFDFQFDIQKGKTIFHFFQSLETSPTENIYGLGR